MLKNPEGEHRRSPFFFTASSPLDSRQGFTLVELSIVLVIIGILVSLGASTLGPLTKRAKFAETRETVKAMKEAVVNYAVTHRETPCGATDTCAGTDGDLRFNQLSNATDSLRSPLFFTYSSNLRQEAGNLNLCSATTTSLTLRLCHNVACTVSDSIPNVAFVVGSRGLNLNKQTNGGGRITAATVITVYDQDILSVPDGDTTDVNRIEDFDDVYTYVTLSELQAKIPCMACTAYEVYNGPAGPAADFRNNLTGACYQNVAANTLITSVGSGGSVERHTAGASCTGLLRTISFSAASTADSNKNCQVDSTAAGLSDR
jgi:prepilin-type N-terminal cleavage/methylation domain-containing protein